MDFKEAQYTAIISDLHLCEAEPVHPKYPLWKKYKTKEFFFDHKIDGFLKLIVREAGDNPIELVLNGDIFDFDSVTRYPEKPSFRVKAHEKKYGLKSTERKSLYKIDSILDDHPGFLEALREFLKNGNRIIFVIGNHDLELYWEAVQKRIIERITPDPERQEAIRFCEFFYISNSDTLVEHGHQYDPYCKVENPVFPFILRYNQVEIRIPFGNLATRYMINVMGFFNPYVESNFIMSAGEYVVFFLKYMARAQPLLIIDWLVGASQVLFRSVRDEFTAAFRDPLLVERRVAEIAAKSNATPRMVREMLNFSVPSASKSPWLLARELWLDRAFIFLLSIILVLQISLVVQQLTDISIYWTVIPLLLFAPFFIFYSRTVVSKVGQFKEPQERILSLASMVTGTERIVHGHTHILRHEVIGPIEHLNPGTWSPAFKDIHCKQVSENRAAVWITPGDEGRRKAQLLKFNEGDLEEFFKKNDSRSASIEEKETILAE